MVKTINKQELHEFARSQGLDLFGVANIERFEHAPVRMHPASIMPAARSVIVVGRRILRGNWRGIEEGTYWPTYSYYGYSGLLNTFFMPFGVYETSCFVEDHGWEAVPYYAGVPEGQAPREPIRPGGVAHNVHLAIRIAATAAGVGEIGWSKVFLTRQFGPRQRLAAIITDAVLEPDPLLEPGSLCTRCMKCESGCPADAIPHLRDDDTISITIEDKTYTWGNVHMGRCTLCYHGGDPRVSPFIHKSLPGYEFDVRRQRMSEERAYSFCWPMSTGSWRETAENPSGKIIEGHAQIAQWGAGGLGVEGSRGCMRSCFNHLEHLGDCGQIFHGGDFIKRDRWLLPERVALEDERE